MIIHRYINPNADDPTSTITRPTNWNDVHVVGDALVNANASAMIPGAPVYCSGPGRMDLAKADNAATAECIGLMVGLYDTTGFTPGVAVPNASQGIVQEVDSVTLSTAQWDVLTGGSGGLTPEARYYVSATTAGRLTTVAPSTPGTTFVVSIGTALTPTTLRLRVQMPIGN